MASASFIIREGILNSFFSSPFGPLPPAYFQMLRSPALLQPEFGASCLHRVFPDHECSIRKTSSRWHIRSCYKTPCIYQTRYVIVISSPPKCLFCEWSTADNSSIAIPVEGTLGVWPTCFCKTLTVELTGGFAVPSAPFTALCPGGCKNSFVSCGISPR